MDLSAPGGVLDHRTWRWLLVRLRGLLSAETRIGRALAPPPKQGPQSY